MRAQRSIAVVVPAYNEADKLAAVLRTMPAWVDHVIVVDDGSTDDTAGVVRAWQAAPPGPFPRVLLRVHHRNRGVGAALVTGYRTALAAHADVIAVMAGDGQMHPDDLAAVVEPVLVGAADYVKGNRFASAGVWREMPVQRALANLGLSFVTRAATGYAVYDSQCGYTAIAAPMLARLLAGPGMYARYGYPNDLLGRLRQLGARVAEVPVRAVYGPAWRSGIPWHVALHPLPWLLARAGWRRWQWQRGAAAEGSAVAADAMREAGPLDADVTAWRLGIVTTSYPRWPGDVAGHFVQAQAQWLAGLGHEVEVVAFGAAGGREGGRSIGATGPEVVVERAQDVSSLRAATSSVAGTAPSVHRLASSLFFGEGAPDRLERRGWRAWPAAAHAQLVQLAAVARRLPTWDAVCAHWAAPSALSVATVRALAKTLTPGSPVARMPFLVVFHGGDVAVLARYGVLGPVVRWLCAQEARLVFVSAHAHEQARMAAAVPLEVWRQRAAVHPMPLGEEFLFEPSAHTTTSQHAASPPQPAAASMASPPPPPSPPPASSNSPPSPLSPEPSRHQSAPSSTAVRVGMVGRLVPQKGFDLALAALPDIQTPCEVLLLGDGPQRAQLLAQADAVMRAHPRHRVTWLGERHPREMPSWYRRCDVVWVPSRGASADGRGEGMPLVAREALACGVAVLLTPSGGLCELVGLPGVVALPAVADPDVGRALATAMNQGQWRTAWQDASSRDAGLQPPHPGSQLAAGTSQPFGAWSTAGAAWLAHWGLLPHQETNSCPA